MAIPKTSIIDTTFRRPVQPGKLPEISSELETIRTYQFEVSFQGFPAIVQAGNDADVTVAAKQVGQITYGVDSISLDRLNDKVHYPGKPAYEPVEITFDNLLLKNSTPILWQSFKEVYNPVTGKSGYRGGNGAKYKGEKMTIVEMNGDNFPVAGVELFGVYPEKVAFSEKNYSTNEFSTVTVTFRFDFINYSKVSIDNGPGTFRNRSRQ